MTGFNSWVRSVLEMKSEPAAQMPTFESKAIDFELKADDDEKNVIQGYASTFNGEPDAYNDIVAPGAFAKTIAERGEEIKFLFGHDWYQIIGRVIEIREDSYGLWFKAKISETERGKEIITLVKDKVLTKISIGYRTKEYKWDSEKGIRTLLEVDLFELSVVPMPANDRAIITGVKEQVGLPHPAAQAPASLPVEEKTGRVLSAKTEKSLREAFDAMAVASEAMKIAQKEVMDVLESVNSTDDADDDDDDEKGASIIESTPPVTITVDEPKMSADAIQEIVAAAVKQALAEKAAADNVAAEHEAKAAAEAAEREAMLSMLNQITQLAKPTTEAQ